MDVASQNEKRLQYEPEVNYHRAWRAFSRRHFTAIFLLFLWPVVAVGLFALSRFWIHEPVISLVIIVVWLALALAAVWWAGEFRCRRRYAALGHKRGTTNLTRGLFDQVCSNCKLRKFEDGERRVQPSERPVAMVNAPMIERESLASVASLTPEPVVAVEPVAVEPVAVEAAQLVVEPKPSIVEAGGVVAKPKRPAPRRTRKATL